TGRYPARTGAYRTSSGRTMLHRDEQTIANIFSDAGYDKLEYRSIRFEEETLDMALVFQYLDKRLWAKYRL
ncbi:MAG: hypothetical protein EBY39_03920, partial [Flavobacteriia bacterium]|nr:hypothetical protein [Flavobacteriia bacterium]